MASSSTKPSDSSRKKIPSAPEPPKKHSTFSGILSRSHTSNLEEDGNSASSSRRLSRHHLVHLAPAGTSKRSQSRPARDEFQLHPEDVLIAVMGMTGSGKSTFISHLTEDDVKIGHELESCTDKVAIYPADMPDGSRIFLMDTPGFDDTFKPDTEILREVAGWLNESYKKKLLLSGIVYLHRIQDVRFTGAAMTNLRMFKKLCGSDGLGNVILTTTAWSGVSEEEGLNREKQLREKEEFWKGMVDQGSEIFRHDDNEESARRIVEHIIDKKKRIALAIQYEMEDKKLSLEQTAAGREVEAQMEEIKAEWEKERRALREELEEALANKDKEAAIAIRKERKEIEKKMRENDESVKRLKVNNEELAKELAQQRKKIEKDMRKLDIFIKKEEQKERSFFRRYNPWHNKLDNNFDLTDSESSGYDSGDETEDSSTIRRRDRNPRITYKQTSLIDAIRNTKTRSRRRSLSPRNEYSLSDSDTSRRSRRQ